MHSTALKHKIKTDEDLQACSSLRCPLCNDGQTSRCRNTVFKSSGIGCKDHRTFQDQGQRSKILLGARHIYALHGSPILRYYDLEHTSVDTVRVSRTSYSSSLLSSYRSAMSMTRSPRVNSQYRDRSTPVDPRSCHVPMREYLFCLE